MYVVIPLPPNQRFCPVGAIPSVHLPTHPHQHTGSLIPLTNLRALRSSAFLRVTIHSAFHIPHPIIPSTNPQNVHSLGASPSLWYNEILRYHPSIAANQYGARSNH